MMLILPAMRSLFSFWVRWADGKRVFCHESKLTVLSMRGGFLATESSRDTSCCVDSLNNSGITVKECAGVTVSKQNMGHAV